MPRLQVLQVYMGNGVRGGGHNRPRFWFFLFRPDFISAIEVVERESEGRLENSVFRRYSEGNFKSPVWERGVRPPLKRYRGRRRHPPRRDFTRVMPPPPPPKKRNNIPFPLLSQLIFIPDLYFFRAPPPIFVGGLLLSSSSFHISSSSLA